MSGPLQTPSKLGVGLSQSSAMSHLMLDGAPSGSEPSSSSPPDFPAHLSLFLSPPPHASRGPHGSLQQPLTEQDSDVHQARRRPAPVSSQPSRTAAALGILCKHPVVPAVLYVDSPTPCSGSPLPTTTTLYPCPGAHLGGGGECTYSYLN